MKPTHTLTRHHDIRKWVAERHGAPALRRVPDRFGGLSASLTLKLARSPQRPRLAPSQDDGITPCSWTAWLAELDRQNLALRVSDQGGFEFIDRRRGS